MRNVDVGQAASLLANIGVIASLIFVGLQLRQEADATRSSTVLQLKQSWVETNLATATSPELVDAFNELNTVGWSAASPHAKS